MRTALCKKIWILGTGQKQDLDVSEVIGKIVAFQHYLVILK
jgi:hypothetical protein